MFINLHQFHQHPQVVDDGRISLAAGARARREPGPFRVGIEVGRPRAGADPLSVLPVLTEVVQALPDAVLQVYLRPEAVDAGGMPHERALGTFLRLAAERGLLEIRTQGPVDGEGAWDHLSDLDTVVLAYRLGAHSTLLEACRDLGASVIAPSCGWFSEQGPVLTYVSDDDGVDVASLVRAVVHAHHDRPRFAATVVERHRQRRASAAALERLHAEVLAER